jgi:hypothetical protein
MPWYNTLVPDHNFDEVKVLHLIREKIPDLSVLSRYVNLTTLVILGCDIDKDSLLTFDFEKLPQLENLVFKYNCPGKHSYVYYRDFIIKRLNDKLGLGNREEATKLYEIMLSSYYMEKYLEYGYSKSQLTMKLDEIKLKLEEIKNIIFECEKELYAEDMINMNKIPLNKTIFNCGLKSLTIDFFKIKEFFKELPDKCKLIDSVEFFGYGSTHYSKPNEHNFTYDFNNYTKQFKKESKYSISNLETESPICKLSLFPNLKSRVFEFIETDFHEYIEIDKCKSKKKEDLLPVDNIVLYYKDYCLTTIIFNKPINYKEDISHLKIDILDYGYAFDNDFNNKMLCLNGVPGINTLILDCISEYHDNYNSTHASSEYDINNLPLTLTNLKLRGISQTMIDNFTKIPFGCKLEYQIMKSEY